MQELNLYISKSCPYVCLNYKIDGVFFPSLI